MKKIPLADTGQLVSELCLGTMYFGTRLDQYQSEALLDTFCQSGGSFIDTANNYAFWKEGATGNESETVVGQWLQRQSRDRLVIATKCGARPTHYQGDLETVNLEGLGYETIIKSVENSLKRLKTDYIDILYAHVDFMDSPVEERLIAFTKLKEQGKIRFAGSSNTEAWRVQHSQQLSENKNYIPYACVQQKYSYLRPKRSADLWLQKLLNQELMHYAEFNKNVTLLAYSTLLSGLYSKSEKDLPPEYRTTDNELRMALLKSLAEAKGCSLNQLVLAWMMHHQVRIIPIIAGSKTKHIIESIEATQVVLNEHEMSLLNNAGE